MTKKKWALLILCALLAFGWFKFFYKRYTETQVAKSADCIIALDVKRITNTFIWNIITTPSQWKISSPPPGEGKVSWDDMVKLPDYVFIFHAAGQPPNAWYTLVEIKDAADFNKGLQQYHFEKKAGIFFSKELGVELVQSGERLLVGNPAVNNKNYLKQIADELFIKKQYASKEKLKRNIAAGSHLSAQIEGNHFLKDQSFLTANFDKKEIIISADLTPKSNNSFTTNNFLYSDSSLCTLLFTQPPPAVYSLLSDSAWAGISKAFNFNIDSLLLPTNTFYQLDVEGIHSSVDSAISYTYDDNFNPVEKSVVNIVEEPAFNFAVQGADVNRVYEHWKNNGKLEQTAAGELFTPMPFVKSYCHKINEKQLFITSDNYKPAPGKQSVQCILFFKLLLARIPSSLLKYLPGEWITFIKNLESVEGIIDNKKGQIVFQVTFKKKKNDLPIIE